VQLVGSLDNTLYKLNASDGTLLWRFPTNGSVSCSPAVAGNAVYFGSWDGNVYAVSLTDGALLWKFHAGDKVYSVRCCLPGLSPRTPWVQSVLCVPKA
jgi:outer membrane protein assembly factor BamB